MSPEVQTFFLAICVSIGTALLYLGVLKPTGLAGLRRDALPENRDARIAAMECDTLMCAHVVDGEHPTRVRTSFGREFWRLSDGRLWEVDQPCPFR